MSSAEYAPPTAALRPSDEREIVEAVRAARADGRRLVPVGAGTSLAACRPDAAGADLLDVRALVPAGSEGIVSYVPGDGVLTALAGARVGALAEALRAGGHRLTPRPSTPDLEGTLGGMVGAGASGRDRIAHGPLRHHVLGLSFVDGTGRVARSGGRLVKNVTGFDLHRLFVGARGTLGVALEVSLRLVPAPEHEVSLERDLGDVRAALDDALRLRAETRIRPAFLFLVGSRLVLGLAGRRAQVEEEVRRAIDLVGTFGDPVVGADAAQDAIDRGAPVSRAAGGAAGGAAALVLGIRPSRAGALLEALGEAGVRLDGALVEPDAARVELSAEALEGAAPDLGARVARVGATAIAHAPPLVYAFPDRRPYGVRAIEERLRATFDPGGVFGEPRPLPPSAR